MERYFREQGFRAFSFRGEWSDLQHHLQQGRPLIVCLKASGGRGPLHYSVVVGLDPEHEFVFLNDPAVGKMLRISREGFQSEWDSAKNWTLLAVPESVR
jgi:predicted double-glycine peptidase